MLNLGISRFFYQLVFIVGMKTELTKRSYFA